MYRELSDKKFQKGMDTLLTSNRLISIEPVALTFKLAQKEHLD